MREIVCIFGRQEKGKTTLALHFAKRVHAGKGILVWDPRARITAGVTVRTYEETLRAIAAGAELIVFYGVEVERDFAEFARAAWSLQRVAIVIDEASYLESCNWMNEDLDRLVRLGNQQEISLVLTQHEIKDTYSLMRNLWTATVFFETRHVPELERVEEIGGPEVRRAVESLRERDFLRYEVRGDSWHVNRDPRSWRESIYTAETAARAANGRAPEPVERFSGPGIGYQAREAVA